MNEGIYKNELLPVDDEFFDAESLDSPQDDDELINVGEWYWYECTGEPQDFIGEGKYDDPDPNLIKPRKYLGCVIHVGSNYAKLKFPTRDCYTWTERIHFDNWDDVCQRETNWRPIINEKIGVIKTEIKGKLDQIKYLASRLGAVPQVEQQVQSNSLSVISKAGDPLEFKQQLIKAKDETLPMLFAQIEALHAKQALWLNGMLIHAKSQSRGIQDVTKHIENQIVSVELYAGLLESVVKIREGEPAPSGTKLHLLQRRCYMDEECIAGYRHGGVECQTIETFDKWLSRSENYQRILPFDRSMVAFRVRRHEKERSASNLYEAFVNMDLAELDKLTFLYVRNGSSIYRLETSHEFGSSLFPNRDEFDFSEKHWICDKGDSMITDRDYQQRKIDLIKFRAKESERLRNYRKWEQKNRLTPTGRKSKKRNPFGRMDRWGDTTSGRRRGRNKRAEFKKWEPCDSSSVYFDDVQERIASEVRDYNRISLIIQGLFDRSEVLHPHPKVKTWTEQGMDDAVELVYRDRALHDGERPDYQAYTQKLRESISVGSIVMGHRKAWMIRMAQIENSKERRVWKNGYHTWEHPSHTTYRPPGNPGPSLITTVEKLRKRNGETQALFTWMRRDIREVKKSYRNYNDYPDKLDKFWCPVSSLFHITAYQQGDFHKFFDDPRTRSDYLKWAGQLLTAEEYLAGNLNEDGKWDRSTNKGAQWKISQMSFGGGEDGTMVIKVRSGGSFKVRVENRQRFSWGKRKMQNEEEWQTTKLPKWVKDQMVPDDD